MTFLLSVTEHFSAALSCLPRTDKLSYSMQICRVKSNDWQPIWVLLSQPVSNCHIWFIYQLSRASTLSFSPLFLLGGKRISWLVVLALRRNSNPEWFLVWVSRITWSWALASSLARPSVVCFLVFGVSGWNTDFITSALSWCSYLLSWSFLIY